MEDSSPGPPPPPSDADDWTEEQWIAWLEAVDAAEDPPPARAPRRLRDRRPASMLGNAMLGLHEVIYGRPDEIVIVADAGGDPPGDDRPELFLDPDHPERSEVMIRRRRPPAPEAEEGAGERSEGPSQGDPAGGAPDGA